MGKLMKQAERFARSPKAKTYEKKMLRKAEDPKTREKISKRFAKFRKKALAGESGARGRSPPRLCGTWDLTGRAQKEEDAAVIDLLGMVVFGTIVGIGLLDGRRGLSVFALYHSAA